MRIVTQFCCSARSSRRFSAYSSGIESVLGTYQLHHLKVDWIKSIRKKLQGTIFQWSKKEKKRIIIALLMHIILSSPDIWKNTVQNYLAGKHKAPEIFTTHNLLKKNHIFSISCEKIAGFNPNHFN